MTTLQDLSCLDEAELFDVCIIGSGFAGTVLGKSLAEAGVRTIILESGGTLLNWFLSGNIRELAAYQLSGNTDYPLVRTRARALGGTSNFWTGRCERLHPSDFEVNPFTPVGAPWPITYGDIEPYYERAERTLRVRGSNLSQYHPPRRNNLPLPAKPDISGLKSLLTEVGVTVDDSLTATPTKGWRFFRVSKELLPGFASSPSATLVPRVTATKIIPDVDRRVVGVEVQTMERVRKTVRARFHVVACGGIESPRLLLLSQSEAFPKGIGNSNDRVGRGFTEHPGLNYYGRIPHRWSTVYPRHKVGRSHQFYDQFRSEGLGSTLLAFIQSWVFPHHQRDIRVRELPRQVLSALSRVKRAQIYIGPTTEMRPCDSNRVTLSEHQKDHFGNPIPHLHFSYTEEDLRTLDRARALTLKIFADLGAQSVTEAEVTWARHHIGSCRMGDNPATSVVDRNLHVHESPNLYVCGSEVFVTGGAVQPALTITALAHRLADHLVSRLKSG